MKLLVLIICINFLQVFSREKEKEREMVLRLLTECKAKEGASEAEYGNLVLEKLPETKEGSCMLACAYEKVGLVSFHKNYILIKE